MKFATLRNGARDGRLAMVSRDLAWCADATAIAPTLQAALDDWPRLAPKLAVLARDVELGSVPRERFHERDALSPLPRAFQWVDGSAYVDHVELERRARGAEMPQSFSTDPLMYRGASDAFLAPREPIRMPDEAFGIDCEGEVAVVVDDVPMGADVAAAGSAIRLLMLVNAVSLRELIPAELAKGYGFVQSKPSSAFSPVAVTPDELGAAWHGGKIQLPLLVAINGAPFGKAAAGVDMAFDFPQLISHAARTRPLAAGTIVSSGTVSNKGRDGSLGRPIGEGGVGYSRIAELRAIETIRDGVAKTPFLRFGNTVRIEMKDAGGRSIFGAIEQTVEQLQA